MLVIGSQAIHASTDELIPEAERSIEVDVSSLEDEDGRKADLIVLGSRGRGRMEGLLLGSVSQKIAALAPCPCLIAR